QRVAALTLTAKDAAPAEDDELLQLLEDMTVSLSFALRSLEHARAAQYLARFDPLTGLAKRALFGDRLDAELQLPGDAPERMRLAVVAFDVHGLGSINATHGERFGDLALQSLAERLKRYGGGDGRLGYLGAGTFVLIERTADSVLDGIQIALDAAVL